MKYLKPKKLKMNNSQKSKKNSEMEAFKKN